MPAFGAGQNRSRNGFYLIPPGVFLIPILIYNNPAIIYEKKPVSSVLGGM